MKMLFYASLFVFNAVTLFSAQYYSFLINETGEAGAFLSQHSIGSIDVAGEFTPIIRQGGVLYGPVLFNPENQPLFGVKATEGGAAEVKKLNVKIPNGESTVLVLFFPTKNPGRLATFVLPLDAILLKTNQVVGLNLTGSSIALRINDDRGLVEPGKYLVSELNSDNGYRVPLQVFQNTDQDDWKMVYSQRAIVSPTGNQIKIFYNSFRDGRSNIIDVNLEHSNPIEEAELLNQGS